MKQPVVSNLPQAKDFERIRAWKDSHFAAPQALPFSFQLDGQLIAGIPESWRPVVRQRRIDSNLVETVYEGTEPSGGRSLRVELLAYQDFPVLEWTVWLKNTAATPTALIEDLLGLAGVFAGQEPVLQHCNGDFYSAAGYTPQETALQAGKPLHFAPSGGRPCDGALPYYRLLFADYGLNLAIGWPCQWSAVFQAQPEGVQVSAGQEKTHLRLLAGETIRTPRITLMAWDGDKARAANLWRRWYLAHILPRPDGQPLKPMLPFGASEGGEEFTNATEENQLRLMDRCRQAGIDFDIWWIDAGWYPCHDGKKKNWTKTGSWRPDPERFPRGLQPIGEKVKSYGASFLVWFEPERVYSGTDLHRDHPEWLLKVNEITGGEIDESSLLDLGNPACRRWLTDHICNFIAENHIRIYRQDFNFPPLAYLRDNDAPDRQGIHENLHVQGYLQFWDDLLERNPGLWIDSCASGGRRNDLESMRRSVPLHYSDYGYGDAPVKLSFQHTMYAWLPYFKETALSWDLFGPGVEVPPDQQVDRFAYHCALAVMLFPSLDIRRDDIDLGLVREMIAVWRKAAGTLLHGDYYPLTPFSKSSEQWLVRQFECPEDAHGLLQGIRLPGSQDASITVYPHIESESAMYRFENPETHATAEVSGAILRKDGFTFSLPARSGAIWFYHWQ